MAIGKGKGENRAVDAAVAAVSSELVDVSINGAKGVLLNVKGGENMTLTEVSEAAELVREMVDPDANIIFGASIDDSLGDVIQITVIATGFDGAVSAEVATPVRLSRSADTAQPKTVAFPSKGVPKGDWDLPPSIRQRAMAPASRPGTSDRSKAESKVPEFLKNHHTG